MLWRVALFMNAIILAMVLALFYSQRPAYQGPPVAAFTTGNAPCSPICGPKQ